MQETRIEMLKKFIEEDEGDIFSRYALALEYIAINNPDEAISLLEKILARDSTYLAAYYQLGKLYEKTSSPQKAKVIYEKGMEIARAQKNLKTLSELGAALDGME